MARSVRIGRADKAGLLRVLDRAAYWLAYSFGARWHWREQAHHHTASIDNVATRKASPSPSSAITFSPATHFAVHMAPASTPTCSLARPFAVTKATDLRAFGVNAGLLGWF